MSSLLRFTQAHFSTLSHPLTCTCAQSHPSAGHTHAGLYSNVRSLFGYMLVLISPLFCLAASWEGAQALIHDQYLLPMSALFPHASATPKFNPYLPVIVPMRHKRDPWSPLEPPLQGRSSTELQWGVGGPLGQGHQLDLPSGSHSSSLREGK